MSSALREMRWVFPRLTLSKFVKNTFIINEICVDIKSLFVAIYVFPIYIAEGADLYAVFVVILDEGLWNHGLRHADRADNITKFASEWSVHEPTWALTVNAPAARAPNMTHLGFEDFMDLARFCVGW